MENPSDDHNGTLKDPLIVPTNQKGGFRTLPFIIGNEALERMATYGLMANMIIYLTREYGMESAKATNVLLIWTSATSFTPILGALVADSYVSRYRMIGFGCIASILGMLLLWSTTSIPQARPSPPCDHLINTTCNSSAATPLQLLLLYSSLAFISVGAGGVRSSSLAFGADQLCNIGEGGKDKNLNHPRSLESFFSWYYVSVSVSVIVSITGVVYIQESMGWEVGFGVPVILMMFSAFSFFLASPFYVKCEPQASLLVGFAQVVVASFKHRSSQVPTDAANVMYHQEKGTPCRVPSEKLRFLNKACIIRNPEEDLTATDGKASDPWSLCTVDQVEELKRVIRIIPIWSSGMLTSVNISQTSFPVLQAATLDRRVTPKFEIPAASLGVFMMLSLMACVALYDRIIVPVASRIKGKPTGLSLKQKMGFGILLSSASMAAFAILEAVRRDTAIKQGFTEDPNAVVHVSAAWVLPYQALGGMAEAFNAIGQNEFYYKELSKSMSSVASNLFMLGFSAANLVASLIVKVVDDVSKREGGESWVGSNINKGHYDYYYWLLGGLSLVNFVYYVACCKAYGPCSSEVRDDDDSLR